MLTSNRTAGTVAAEMRIQAATDVTGFGLVGHLLEMLRAADVAAELSLGSLPLVPGVVELSALGIESTLAPANRTAETYLQGHEKMGRDNRYAALFDPQTSGGLLLGVAENQLATLLERLGRAATVVGRVLPSPECGPTVHVLE